VQVIEVYNVVVHVLRAEHDITNQFSVGRNDDIERVFYGAYGSKGVNGSTYAAYTAYVSPGIARVAALEDLFQQTYHGTAAEGILDLTVLNIGFDA
jgi:hypothetical protein